MPLPFRAYFLALSGAIILATGSMASEAAADGANVKIKSTALRSQPKAWASSVAVLNYGDALELIGAEGAWMKAKAKGGKTGYVHSSALTTKKVLLASSKAPAAQVDRADIVMAGKGFSKEIERQFASTNGTLNYSAVNEVEKQRVGAGELSSFIKSGKLKG